MRISEKLTIMAAAAILSSCAGPTSPFGAQALVFSEFRAEPQKLIKHAIEQELSQRQVYHTPFDLVLNIEDDERIPRNFRFEILHNGKRIQRWWKSEKIVLNPKNPRTAKVVFENLSLLPGRKNEITFLYYRDKDSAPIAYKFLPPHCPLRTSRSIASINPFQPKGLEIGSLEKIAKENKINPSFLAALVAQESSFNPMAISWAKAIGLTQVTPLANEDILRHRPDWKHDPQIKDLSFLELKAKIMTKGLTREQDWRLDEAKSLEGGSIYLNLLSNYWKRPHIEKVLDKTFDKDIPLTDILLASYNSGAFRVKRSIMKKKDKWLESKELKEARKYVMNIKSYCHAFSKNQETL
ncbi:MAG: hypothetical protein CME64_17425 [Halobacteriovoraceae bacterium]|nr:hypothetical protein [Halobacteriovoraceae bacterium]|tara:strand:- start:321786 stop:322844 length:1059 start_codon:yes stop_codon:yes gene_type:complete